MATMARPTKNQMILTLITTIVVGFSLVWLYLTYNPDFSTAFLGLVLLTIALLGVEYFLIKPDQSIPVYSKKYGFFASLALGIVGLGTFLILSFITTPFVTGLSQSVFGLQSLFMLQAERVPIFKDNVYLTYFSNGILVGFVENMAFFGALMILIYWGSKQLGASTIPAMVISTVLCAVLFAGFHLGVNLITSKEQALALCNIASTSICTTSLLWNNFLWGLVIGSFNWITGSQISMWAAHGSNDAIVTSMKYAAQKALTGGTA